MSDSVTLAGDQPAAHPPAERAAERGRLLTVLLPLAVLVASVIGWEALVRLNDIPHYILPAPTRIVQSLVEDWAVLYGALLNTLRITLFGLLSAIVGAVVLAILFTRARWIELSFAPYAVILQVTPLIAIAPILTIYFGFEATVYISAFIVSFFPILSNTLTGLRSTDHGLMNLFDLYGASGFQKLVRLQLPSALPYFLTGLKIAGGLALIGAIVAEFVSGAAGQGAGLAYRILEAGYRLNIPRMFAALVLISTTGILIFLFFTVLSYLLLRQWHESAVKREN